MFIARIPNPFRAEGAGGRMAHRYKTGHYSGVKSRSFV